MELTFEELKSIILEKGDENWDIVYYPIYNSIICGTPVLDDNCDLTLEKNEVLLRYSKKTEKIQKMSSSGELYTPQFRIVWINFNGNTFKEHGKNFHFFKNKEDVDEFLKKYAEENKELIAKQITKKIKEMGSEQRQCIANIKTLKEKIKELDKKIEIAGGKRLQLLKPEFIKSAKVGDIYETRCGLKVEVISLGLDSEDGPNVKFITDNEQYPNLVKHGYCVYYEWNGKFDPDEEEHDFDLIKKL